MAHKIPRLILSQVPTLLLTLALLPVLVACGQGGMSIRSAAFNTSGSTAVVYGAVEPSTPVNVFHVCVARIRLDGEDDEAVAGAEDVRFTPGLIDLSSGEARDWGNVELPQGIRVKRIRIKVKKDKDLCGTEYAVKFNEHETDNDIEFKFTFDPALTLENADDELELSMQKVVEVLRLAGDAGELQNNLKSKIESVEGTARRL